MLHFLYASDEGFVPVLKASILSLLRAHTGRSITIHVVAERLSAESRSAVTNLVEGFAQRVSIVNMPDFATEFGDVDTKRFTLSAFSRLFLDILVPSDVERIIYLDCDTIVQRDLTDLWETDLGGCVIGAVHDCRNWRYARHLGLAKGATYINSGVLLIDVVSYRTQEWRNRFTRAILTYDGLLDFPDNDLICLLMQDHLYILPPEYNLISPVRIYDFDDVVRLRRPSGYYSRADVEAARSNPAILHYTTFVLRPGRPWKEGYDEADGAIFRRYLAESGGSPRPAASTSVLGRLAARVVASPLRPVALTILGVVHGVLKPALARRTRKQIAAIGRVQ